MNSNMNYSDPCYFPKLKMIPERVKARSILLENKEASKPQELLNRTQNPYLNPRFNIATDICSLYGLSKLLAF